MKVHISFLWIPCKDTVVFRTFFQHLCEWAILAFLSFAILWKGGKSLESTWILLGVGAFVILITYLWLRPVSRMRKRNAVHAHASLLDN
jgi:hypothetical protein